MYGQGRTWQECCPAGFMSKQFTITQHNYTMHELETLAILKALLKWEDKLIGYRVHIITDHKALEFFQTQSNLTSQQRRWTDYLSWFDFDITYIKGELNKVVDCLSQYYESDTMADIHQPHEYMQADAHIDPTGDDLPVQHYQEITSKIIELRAIRSMEFCRSKQLQEQQETRDLEARLMDEANQCIIDNVSHMAEAPSVSEKLSEKSTPSSYGDDLTLAEVLFERTANATPITWGDEEFIKQIQSGYKNDKLFSLILDKPTGYPDFAIKNGLIWWINQHFDEVMCIPCNQDMITQILDQSHTILGHFRDQRTNEYTRRWYWWPLMNKDVHQKIVVSCKIYL